jgi:predicted RNA polymerase sigma factor
LREPADGSPPVSDRDDSLMPLFLCCHPVLTPGSATLTLRAVGGLTTAEIARALLAPEATMAQPISHVKQRIKASGVPFAMPTSGEWGGRLRSVLHVLFLIFTEGHAASTGRRVARSEQSAEAIRPTRIVPASLPDDPEVAGPLALTTPLGVETRRRPCNHDGGGGAYSNVRDHRCRKHIRVGAEGG